MFQRTLRGPCPHLPALSRALPQVKYRGCIQVANFYPEPHQPRPGLIEVCVVPVFFPLMVACCPDILVSPLVRPTSLSHSVIHPPTICNLCPSGEPVCQAMLGTGQAVDDRRAFRLGRGGHQMRRHQHEPAQGETQHPPPRSPLSLTSVIVRCWRSASMSSHALPKHVQCSVFS